MYFNIITVLIGVAEEHSELVKKFRQQDKTYLEEIIQGHISGEKPFASLTSRSVDYTNYKNNFILRFPTDVLMVILSCIGLLKLVYMI